MLRCQRGQRDAFEELISAWERRLFYYIRRLVRDEEEAWSLLQEVWIKVLRSIRQLHDPNRLPVWLYALTRNTVMSHHRFRYDHASKQDPLVIDPPDVGDPYARLEDAEQVHHALAKVPSADREVLTLFFLRDLSIGEVAEVLQIPTGTVKSRLFKARKSLRAVLIPEGENDDESQ